MKLKELEEKLRSGHFKLTIIMLGEKQPLFEAIPTNSQINKYSDLEVAYVDCTQEVGELSPLTHSVTIRPILEIVCIKE